MSEPDSALSRALAWLRLTWNQAPPTLRQRWPWFIVGGALLGFLVVLGVRWASPSGDDAGESPVATDDRGAAGMAGEVGAAGMAGEVGAAGTAGEEGAAGTAGEEGEGSAPVEPPLKPGATAADAGAPLSPNVKLTFRTFPARRASVTWGNKRLGFTDRGKPLVVERVRDSGPLDVVVRAQGYLPVHVRAYTFNDASVDVKITPVEKKDTIYGYQQPLTDAGVPELAAP